MAKAAKGKAKRKSAYLNDVFITGTLRFPKVKPGEPDEYEGKVFYSSPVVVDDTELARVKKLLTDFGKKHHPDAEKIWLPIKADKKNPDIKFFNIQWKKLDDDGELIPPFIVDGRRKTLPKSIVTRIGAGSVVKVKVTGMEFDPTALTGGLPGVTLLPECIQLKKLVEGRNALAGFEDDEDAFIADEEGNEDIEANTDTSGDEGGAGDAYAL